MRSTLFNLAFYGFTFCMALTLWLIARLGGSRGRLWDTARLWGRGTLWLLRTLLGARVEVRGRAHLKPGQSQLIVSKHQSELDIVMIAALFRDVSAVAMAELARYPFFGAFLRRFDLILVSVEGGPQGRTQAVREGGARIAAEGRSMIIYPEGELMRPGARERYRAGAFHLYEAMGVEAVPVAASLGVIWPRRDWHKHAGTTGVIEFLQPIPPGLDRETFMAEIERRIETRTMALIAETAPPAILSEARDRHARGLNNAGEPASP